jgi:hypothetical protein
MKRWLPWTVAACLVALAAVVLQTRNAPAPAPAPSVLAVQSLGELRLARHEYRDALVWQTHRDPIEWLASVPLAREATHALTRNEAVGTMEGRVDAGLDFSRVKATYTGGVLRLTLPEPTVLDFRADARIARQKDGLLWRDFDMATAAEARWKEAYRKAALRDGIIERAREQASVVVRQALGPDTVVEFEAPSL